MTIVEALGGQNGQTIVEVLGGKKGQTISDIIIEKGYEPIIDGGGDEDASIVLIDSIIANCFNGDPNGENPAAGLMITENLPNKSDLLNLSTGDWLTVQIDGTTWYDTMVDTVTSTPDGVFVLETNSETALITYVDHMTNVETGDDAPALVIMASRRLTSYDVLPSAAVVGNSVSVIKTEPADDSLPKIFRFIEGSEPDSYEMDPTCDFDSVSDFLTFCEENADLDSGYITISDNYVLVRGGGEPPTIWRNGTKYDGEDYWNWDDGGGGLLKIYDDGTIAPETSK